MNTHDAVVRGMRILLTKLQCDKLSVQGRKELNQFLDTLKNELERGASNAR